MLDEDFFPFVVEMRVKFGQGDLHTYYILIRFKRTVSSMRSVSAFSSGFLTFTLDYKLIGRVVQWPILLSSFLSSFWPCFTYTGGPVGTMHRFLLVPRSYPSLEISSTCQRALNGKRMIGGAKS